MGRITIGSGLALIGLAVGFYFASESRSFTALIPAIFGGAMAILAVVAGVSPEGRGRKLMTASAAFAGIGIVAGLFMGLRGAWKLGGVNLAIAEQLAMAGLCIAAFLADKELWAGWKRFGDIVKYVTTPIRIVVVFVFMSLIYWLLLPFWAVFFKFKDPLRMKLDPSAQSYYEPYKKRDATLEALTYSS